MPDKMFPCTGCNAMTREEDLEEHEGEPYCMFCYEELVDRAGTDVEEDR